MFHSLELCFINHWFELNIVIFSVQNLLRCCASVISVLSRNLHPYYFSASAGLSSAFYHILQYYSVLPIACLFNRRRAHACGLFRSIMHHALTTSVLHHHYVLIIKLFCPMSTVNAAILALAAFGRQDCIHEYSVQIKLIGAGLLSFSFLFFHIRIWDCSFKEVCGLF